MNDTLKWMTESIITQIKAVKRQISGLPHEIQEQIINLSIELLKEEKEQ